MGNFASVLAALSSVITAIAVLYSTVKNAERINEVKREVTTANGSTLAMLADAIEGRRIALVPSDERTEREAEHESVMGEPGTQPAIGEQGHIPEGSSDR